jgi:hypothetical protein
MVYVEFYANMMAQTRTPHFIPVRSADHEVVARYHGSRRHFVRLVFWHDEHGQWFLAGKGRLKFLVALAIIFLSGHEWPQKRPIYEFPHGIYDVIFLWRHFFTGFMTSYFCDVISSPELWRHIFVTTFLHRSYDVIFLWRHFFTEVMTLLLLAKKVTDGHMNRTIKRW